MILTDVPYVLGKNAYASNPSWYVDGDNKNGERFMEEYSKDFTVLYFSVNQEFKRKCPCTLPRHRRTARGVLPLGNVR